MGEVTGTGCLQSLLQSSTGMSLAPVFLTRFDQGVIPVTECVKTSQTFPRNAL